jgi:hypothetical protein
MKEEHTMSKSKDIPEFKSEGKEREFWAKG